MCWQVVYCILPLLILVSCFDAVKVSRDCGEDTLVKLGDAKDDDSAVFLQNGHTNRFDLLPEFPTIHIPCVAILEPGADLATFKKSTLPKRFFFPKGGSGRSTSGSGKHGTSGTQGTGSGTQGTGGGTQGGGSGHIVNSFSPNDSSGEKDGSSGTGRRKEKDLDSPDGDSPDGENQSSTSSAAPSSGPRSFNSISPTTTTRGTDSRVTASSSVVVASKHAVSRSISPTIAAATSGASNTRLALFPAVFSCLVLML